MQTFVEHYTTEEQLNEFTWGQLGKGFLRVGKNIFGKRTVGVGVNLMTSLKSVDRSTYNFVQGALTTNFKNQGSKVKRSTKKDKPKDKIYIQNVYKGEIDDSAKKLGGYDNIKDDIQDVSVYETNKGGRITTFFLEDDQGTEKYYIGTNWRGDKQFKDLFGMWVTSLTSRLNTMRKNPPKTSLNKILEDPKPYLLDLPKYTNIQPRIDDSLPKKDDKEFGVVDITKDDMDSLINILGDGKKGGVVKGMIYPFRYKFVRNIYQHPTNDFKGYKYSDGEHEVYLLDVGNDYNAMIVFGDRESYNWAKSIGMLSSWQVSNKKPEVTWQLGTIDDLLE